MEAIANLILGMLVVLCSLTVMSGIFLWLKIVLLLVTVAYLIVWTKEALR